MEVPKDLGMDAFQYRTEGEEKYAARLAALEPSLVKSCAGRNDVDDRATSLAEPHFCVDFRHLEMAIRTTGRVSNATYVGLERQRGLLFCISV